MGRCRWVAIVWGVACAFGPVGGFAGEKWPDDRPPARVASSDLPAPLVPPNDVPTQPAPLPAAEAPLHEPMAPQAAFSEGSVSSLPTPPLYKMSVGAYGWLPEMYGQVGIRNVTADVGVTTRDMLNLIEHNVHFMFAGQAEVEVEQWSITTSGLYIYAGFDQSIRRLRFSSEASFAIVDAAIGYEIEGLAQSLGMSSDSEIELLAGGRYWLLGGSVTATGPQGNSASRGNDVDWVDPVFGGRLTYALYPDTRLRVRGDIGGFGWWNSSQLTWNVEAVLEKRLFNCLSMAAGYRILDVDYQRGNGRDRFAYDAQLRGPVATMSLDF